MEYWSSLWRHWHEIVAEVGDEEAERWLEETFSNFLARKKQSKWYPEVTLLRQMTCSVIFGATV